MKIWVFFKLIKTYVPRIEVGNMRKISKKNQKNFWVLGFGFWRKNFCSGDDTEIGPRFQFTISKAGFGNTTTATEVTYLENATHLYSLTFRKPL